jgi:ribonuclease VapC
MFVDASAIVAIVVSEDDGQELATRLARADHAHSSALALYEATLALTRIRDMTLSAARAALDEFCDLFRLQITPITAEIGRLAIGAFARFGRGNHKARLNMGDCFAYACARSIGAPLLCKGDDFAQTDIELA